MSQFNIDEIEKRTLSGLKDFQRATVERVDYLFRHNQNRVLVADEVGMGKTLIARGAIVKTARLRIEEKDDLFKVIYICSNQNIANQNIRKLDVTGKNAIGSVSDTRLSMQHLKITEQENDPQIKEGFIQLIPLTPETSFRMTTGGGSVQERALMYTQKNPAYLSRTYHRGETNEYTRYHRGVLEAKIYFGNDIVCSIGSETIENSEEYINKSRDAVKQDCESKAFKRLAKKIKDRFPRLPIIILADGLYVSQTVLEICENNGWDYIIRYKEGLHRR